MYSDSLDCKFSNNSAMKVGGVLYLLDKSTYTKSSNCIFENNFALLGGVI